MKVRDLVEGDQQSDALPPARIYWPTPAPAATIIDLVSLQRPPQGPNRARMSFFECNSAGTTGYTVATGVTGIFTIHALGPNTDLAFYKAIDDSFPRCLTWIYMPIDEGEYITEICRRLPDSDFEWHMFLGLSVGLS